MNEGEKKEGLKEVTNKSSARNDTGREKKEK